MTCKQLVVIAGLSADLFDLLFAERHRFIARTPDGTEFEKLAGTCLIPGEYRDYDRQFVRITETVVSKFSYSPASRYAETSVIVIWFLPDRSWIEKARRDLRFAFTICHAVSDPSLLYLAKKRNARELANLCSRLLGRARQIVRRLRVEIQEKDSRTPLLLPVRNFNEDQLWKHVFSEPFSFGASSSAALPDIEDVLRKIYGAVRKETGQSTTVFVDGHGLRFSAPHKAGPRHGAPTLGGEHSHECYLNGHLRLGVPYHCAFHYDVTGRGGAAVIRQMPDCHDSLAQRHGKPHLNVYPSDYIR